MYMLPISLHWPLQEGEGFEVPGEFVVARGIR